LIVYALFKSVKVNLKDLPIRHYLD